MARASGLTVRTLYHYDEIGLVSAGERTRAGHRRYTPADLRRLYRVRALRRLGLSLDEIATALDRSGDDLAALRGLLTAQLTELETHARRITELRTRISGLLDQLDEGMPEPDQFMTVLERLSTVERYYTEEQWDQLATRRAELGDESVDALRREWVLVAKELHQHLHDGTPVDDPRVQELADRWDTIGRTMMPADDRVADQVKAATDKLWHENHTEMSADLSQKMGFGGPGGMSDVVSFLQRVREAR